MSQTIARRKETLEYCVRLETERKKTRAETCTHLIWPTIDVCEASRQKFTREEQKRRITSDVGVPFDVGNQVGEFLGD